MSAAYGRIPDCRRMVCLTVGQPDWRVGRGVLPAGRAGYSGSAPSVLWRDFLKTCRQSVPYLHKVSESRRERRDFS